MIYELKKLLFHAKSQLMFALLLAFALLSQVYVNQNADMDATAYRTFYEEHAQSSETEIAAALAQRKDSITMDAQDGMDDIVDFARQDALLQQLEKEFQLAYHYEDWREKQITNYERTSEISIFSKGSTFQQEASQKSAERFQKVHAQFTQKMQPSYGISVFFQQPFLDFLILIYVGYVILQLYLQEEQSGFLNFMRIQVKGRTTLLFHKIAASLFSSTLLYTCMLLGCFLLCANHFGMADVSQDCQSVLFFQQAPYTLSLWQMFLLIFCFKLFLLGFFLILLFFLAVISRNILIVAGSFLLGLGIIQGLANVCYEPTSFFYPLQFSQLMHPESVFSRCAYVNVFDHAMDLRWNYVWMLFVMLGCIWYAKRRFAHPYHPHHLKFFHLSSSLHYHSISFYEGKLLLRNCYGGILSILLVAGLLLYLQPIVNVTYYDDILFDYYVDHISSIANEKAVDGIAKEKTRFEQLRQQLDQEENIAKQIELQGKLRFEEGLDRYEMSVLTLMEQQKDATIIKADHVRFVFENSFLQSYLPFASCILILLLCTLIQKKEQDSHMNVLKACSGNEYSLSQRQRRFIVGLASGVLVVLHLSMLWKNAMMVGWDFLTYHTNEYQLLQDLPVSLSLFQYELLLIAYQFLLLVLLSKLLYGWFKKTKEPYAWFFLWLVVLTLTMFDMEGVSFFTFGKILFYPKGYLIPAFAIVLLILCVLQFYIRFKRRGK